MLLQYSRVKRSNLKKVFSYPIHVVCDQILSLASVMDALEAKGFIPIDLIESEVTWFYTALGIDGKWAPN